MNRTVHRCSIAMLTLVWWVAISPVVRADTKDLLSETQKISNENDNLVMAWWIPEDFWRDSFKGRDMTETQIESFLAVLRPYTVFSLVGGQTGAMGGLTYVPIDSIRKTTFLIDAHGNSYAPYADSLVSPDARNFVSMMKPVFANMMGPLGQNMHFVLFPASDTSGAQIAAAREKGAFSISVLDVTFKWRLPLDALLTEKVCKKCGLDGKGSWSFCPWCGEKLP